MAFSIENAFTQLGYLKKDISDVSDSTRIQWAQMISDYIYRNISKTDPERFISTQSYSITAGTNTYALPSDFFHMRSYGTGLYRDDSNGYDTDQRWTLTHYGSSKDGYYIKGTNIILTPDNYQDTQSATLRYIPVSPQYSSVTEYFTIDKTSTGVEIIPDEYLEYIVSALDVMYTRWDEDAGAESIADFRYIRVLDDLLSNIRKTGSVYMMPDLSEIF